MKLLAALVVVMAGTYLGLWGAARLRQRPLDLERLAGGLDLLATEIGHGLTPLPDALLRVQGAIRGPVAHLFGAAARNLGSGQGSVARAWADAVDEMVPRTALSPRDVDILMSLGEVLGKSMSADQLRHLQLARDRLALAISESKDEAHRGERLRIYLGVLGALALVLIVW